MDCDLDSFIQKKELKLKEKLKILMDIARGLEEMHGKKIVHRDIKMKNILIKNEKEDEI